MSKEEVAMRDLTKSLQEWVSAGLIDEDQAQAIRSHEETPQKETRVPLVVEALGYVGGLLALVAIIIILAESWDEIGTFAKLGMVGVVAIVVLGLGAYFKTLPNEAAGRLSSFLWVLGTATVALWSGIFADLVLEVPDKAVPLLSSLAGLALALLLYVLSRSSLQQLVLVVAVGASLVSASVYLEQNVEGIGLAIWGIGVAWLILAWGEQVPPQTTAYVLGSLIMLVGPLALIDAVSWAAILGVLSSVALVTVGVVVRRVVLLGIGGLGLFGYVPAAIFNYFGDSISIAVGLLISSGILLAAALVLARLRSEVRAEPESEEES